MSWRRDVRGYVPGNCRGGEGIQNVDGAGEGHPGKDRKGVLFGVVNKGPVAESPADQRESRLHQKPLENSLSASGGADDRHVPRGQAGGQPVPPELEARVIGGEAFGEKPANPPGGVKGPAAKVSGRDVAASRKNPAA